jgi:recombinational DNA repair protein (RecF pathway)
MVLSDTLGFGWSLDQCMNCNTSSETDIVFLDYENGAVVCQNCKSRIQMTGIKINYKQWQVLKSISEIDINQIKSFMKEILEKVEIDYTNILVKHLSFHTDTFVELKSLKWYG